LKIDPKVLPVNALIDTNVFLRFLDERVDANTPACKDFCNAMIDARHQLWVAAPTIAEVSRHKGKPVPRTNGITVVPFDDRAAEILGLKMPMAKLHEAKAQLGLSLTYLKYDAMIVACALRVKTATLVGLDGDHFALARYLDLEVRRPEYYYQSAPPQLALPLPEEAAPKGTASASSTSESPTPAVESVRKQ
jgi:predicted nucleic acid-binding protein